MTELHTCKNCGNQFSGKFCNQCGEKVYTDHDKKLSHLLEEAFHFITHFEGKFLRTLKLVFFKPGFVSKDICYGVRKKYFKPVSLFLLGVVIYLLFPTLRGMNVHFYAHLSQYEQMHMPFFEQWANAKAAAHQVTLDDISLAFESKSPKVSKLLLLVIIPLTGLWLRLIFYKRKRLYFDHFTLAAEIETFFLYFMFLIIPAAIAIFHSITKWEIQYGDNIWFTSFYIAVLIWYVTVALKRFYAVKTLHAILKSLLFLAGHIIIAYVVYRLILFTIVMLLI